MEERKKTIVNEIIYLKYLHIKENEVQRKKEYYINNYEKLSKINEIIHNSVKGKFKQVKPEVIYKRTFPSYMDRLPDTWKDLINSNLEFYLIERIYVSTEVEVLKKLYSKADETRDYGYYNKKIDSENYLEYKNNYEENCKKIEKYEAVLKAAELIKNNYRRISNEYPNILNEIKDFKKEDFTSEYLTAYEKKFIRIKNEIQVELNKEEEERKRKARERKLERERERRERERERREREEEDDDDEEKPSYNKNYSSSSNYRSNYSSSSSSNNDMKKAYLKLCQDCKNKCVGCY